MAPKRASKKAHEAKKLIFPGSVLRLHSTDLKNAPKTKRFLVLATLPTEQTIAKLYFDSNCPPLPHQLQFEANERGYLDRESYLDCNEIYEDNYSRILNLITINTQAYIGKMNSSDFERVRTQVQIAKTIPRSLKEKYKIIKKLVEY